MRVLLLAVLLSAASPIGESSAELGSAYVSAALGIKSEPRTR